MIYKIFLQLAVVAGMGIILLSPALADEQDDKLMKILNETFIESTTPPSLSSQYMTIYSEIEDVTPQQTMTEMQRILARDRKEGLTTFTDSALSKLLSPGCLPPSTDTATAVQSTTGGLNDSNYYQKKCDSLRKLNDRFAQKLASVKYQNIFSDGIVFNSGFDLLEDVAILKDFIVKQTGQAGGAHTLPEWARDISPDAKYLIGNWGSKPEYEQVSVASLAETMKQFSFKNTDPANLGFCPLPGTTAPVNTIPASTFSDPEKEAIAKSFARFEREKTTPDPSFDNEAVLRKDSSNRLKEAQRKTWEFNQVNCFLDTLLLNQNTNENSNSSSGNLPVQKNKNSNSSSDNTNCILDVFSIKIHFQTGFAQEGAGVIQTRALGKSLIPLRTSLTKLSDAVNELSAQNLQLKNEPRAIFSFGWQDLKFVVPDDFLQIEWVPIVPRVDKKDFTDMGTIKLLADLWDKIRINIDLSNLTASANTSAGEYGTEQANMLAKQKAAEEMTVKLQTQQIQAKNLKSYEEVAGAQMDHLNEELNALLTQFEQLKKISKNFTSTKVQQN